MKVHYKGKYARIRVRSPKSFQKGSFRTHDIGRKGHTKRIAGKLKGNGKWATQAVLIPKGEYKKRTPKVKRTLARIKYLKRR